jgi:hypothetical protein
MLVILAHHIHSKNTYPGAVSEIAQKGKDEEKERET